MSELPRTEKIATEICQRTWIGPDSVDADLLFADIKQAIDTERLRADGLQAKLEVAENEVERVKLRNANLSKCECYSPLENAIDAIRQNQKSEIAQLQARCEAYKRVLEKIYADGRGCEVFPKSHTGEPATDGFVAVEEVLNRTHKGESR